MLNNKMQEDSECVWQRCRAPFIQISSRSNALLVLQKQSTVVSKAAGMTNHWTLTSGWVSLQQCVSESGAVHENQPKAEEGPCPSHCPGEQ